MAAEIKCMKCGASVVAGSKFCPYCGAAVEGVPVTTTATTTPPQGTPVPPKTGAAPEAAPMEVTEGDLGFFDEKPAPGAAPAGPKEVAFTPVEGDEDITFDDDDEPPVVQSVRKGGTSPRTPFRAVQPGDIAKAKAEAQAQADAKAKAEEAARLAAGEAAVRALNRPDPVDSDDKEDNELLDALKREFHRRAAKKRGWLKPALAVLVLILAIVLVAMGWKSCGSPPDYTTAPRRPAPTQGEPAWTEPASPEPTPAQQQEPAPNDGEFPLCSTGRRHRITITLDEYTSAREEGTEIVLDRNGRTVQCRVTPSGNNYAADCCRP